MTEQLPHHPSTAAPIDATARLNDQLRANITCPGANRIVITAGVAGLIGDVSLFRGFHKRAELLRAVRDYAKFDRNNDPHGEHDLGFFEFEKTRCCWKIDFYDPSLSSGSSDPADPTKTTRVLTIMCADEW